MEGLLLKGYKVIELNYTNKIEAENLQVELEHQFNTNLKHFDDKNMCECFFDLKIRGRNDIPLEVHVLISGLFDCPEGVDRKKLHVEAVNELYPFVRAAVVGLTSIAAVPPLPIPMYRVTVSDVNDDTV